MNAIVAIGGPALFRVAHAYRRRVPSAIWVLGLATPRDPSDVGVRSLEALLEPFMDEYLTGESQAALMAISSESALYSSIGDSGDPQLVVGAIRATLEQGLTSAFALVEMLDRAHKLVPVDFVLTDDMSTLARTAIAWAHARGRPVLTAPARLPLRRPAIPQADQTFITSVRARQAFRAADIDDARLAVISAPPAHADELKANERASRRAAAKDAFMRTLGWSATDIVLVVEPALPPESALEPADAFDSSLAEIFAAFGFARASAPHLRLAVIAQPSPDGCARASNIAMAAGIAAGDFAYSDAEHDVWLAGADIVVSVDSSWSIDAAANGIPAINLWRAAGWHLGPAYAAEDGVISALPQTLGATLVALCSNPEIRAEIAGIAMSRIAGDAPAAAVSAIADALVERRRPVSQPQRKTRPDIVVWAPDYSHASGGIRALFRLCHLINLAGGNASMHAPTILHPSWNAPRRQEPITERTIVVIPEIVFGHSSIKRVVRWVLNKPGLLGGPSTYAPEEMVFYYGRGFREAAQLATQEELTEDRNLNVFTVEPELFYNDRSRQRLYDVVYIGKGQELYDRVQPREIRDALVIRRAQSVWPADRTTTAALLRGCRRFYSFDHASAITMEAECCGAQPFLVREDGNVEEIKHDPYIMTDNVERYYSLANVRRFLRLIAERWD